MHSKATRGTGIVGQGAFFFATRVIAFGLAFLVSWTLARSGGTRAWGELAFQIATLNSLAIFTLLGIDTLVVKYLAQTDSQRGRATFEGGLRVVVVASCVMLVAILAVGSLGPRLFDGFWSDFPKIEQVAFALPAFAILRINASALRAGGFMVAYSLFLNVVVMAVLYLEMLIGSTFFGVEYEASTIGWFYVVSIYVSAALVTVDRKRRERDVSQGNRGTAAHHWSIVREAFPLLVVSSMAIIMFNTDLIVLRLFRDEAAVGAYDVAFRLASLVGLGLAAINAVVMPRFSNLFAEQKFAQLSSMVRRTSWAAVALSIPPVAILGIAARWILGVYGADFTVAVDPLRLLLLAQVVSALCGPIGSLLQMTGNERRFQVVFGLATLTNVVMNFALIPAYGMVGAAAASLASTALWNLLAVQVGLDRLGFAAVFSRQAKAA